MLLRNLCAIFLLWILLPGNLLANVCTVKTVSQWNALDANANCSEVNLAGNTLTLNSSTGTLQIDKEKFPNRLVLSNGTINGSDPSVADCIRLLHADVEVRKVRITGCSRHGIQIGDPNAGNSQPARRIFLNNLVIDNIGTHAIYIGRHNQPQPVNDFIRIFNTTIENIGVDGIAGSIGPNALLNIQRSKISRVDQRTKRLLRLNTGLENFCKHRNLSISGGDCIHLQPVRGSLNIAQNQCDHTDVPTKNGFILQNNQGSNNSAGIVNISENRIMMNRSCLAVSGHSSNNNIKPNGIQIENVRHIKIERNEISQVSNGISLNGNWSQETCSIADNNFVSVDQGGQARANVHFTGGKKNCNPHTRNAVDVVQTKLPSEPSAPTGSIVYSRTDTTPAEIRWISADANGVAGHMWVNKRCGQNLTTNPDLEQRRGDWNRMKEIAPGGRPVLQPPCDITSGPPQPSTRKLYNRTDADEYRLIRSENNQTFHHWINHDCAAVLQDQLETVSGTWNEMIRMAPFDGGPWRCQ